MYMYRRITFLQEGKEEVKQFSSFDVKWFQTPTILQQALKTTIILAALKNT